MCESLFSCFAGLVFIGILPGAYCLFLRIRFLFRSRFLVIVTARMLAQVTGRIISCMLVFGHTCKS